MQYTRLGRSGLKVSRLCLGCMTYGAPTERWPWALDEEASRPYIRRALELGLNFFDTANVYSAGASEEVLGRALRDFAKRDDVVIATKVYSPMGSGPNHMGLSRKHVMSEIDASLRRLRTDYIDLYQIHRFDPKTPAEEIMQTLDDVVRSGKVRYIGASSMWAWQFSKLQYTATLNGWTRFASMQPHYNLIYREEEREMLPLCEDMGVGVLPWSPLARGFLAGNRSEEGGQTKRAQSDAYAKELYYNDEDFAVVNRVSDIAKALGASNVQIALAWLLSKRVVTAPIIGATKMEHLDAAVAALEISLGAADVKALEEVYKPRPVAGHR
jgi:aryl-alcohol dehydrogenase-like predicted oxidoreductase